jgi:hypothetical protein
MDTFDGSADALQVSRLIPDGKISRNTGIEVLPYFEELLASRWSRERETSLELATSTLATLRSTN